MTFAQLTGAAGPAASLHRRSKDSGSFGGRLRTGRVAHEHDAGRIFTLGIDEVVVSVDSGQRSNLPVRPAWQNAQAPAAQRGREPQRTNRVAGVMLTVSEGALTCTSMIRANGST